MPSPVGHALAGAAAGWGLVGPPKRGGEGGYREVWRQGALFAMLGMLPDLDLLLPVVDHRTFSHSLTAAVIVGVAAAVLTRRSRVGLAAGAACGTHVLLDWLGSDTTPPIGIMALWPFSHAFYESRLHLFFAISRRFPTRQFWVQNTRALLRELAVLIPPAALAGWRRLVQAGRAAPGAVDPG
jgi:hypothetical protein